MISQLPENPFPAPSNDSHTPDSLCCYPVINWGRQSFSLEILDPATVSPRIRTLQAPYVIHRQQRTHTGRDCRPVHATGESPPSVTRHRRRFPFSYPWKRAYQMVQLRLAYNRNSADVDRWLRKVEDTYENTPIGNASAGLVANYAEAAMLVARLYCNNGQLSEGFSCFDAAIRNLCAMGDAPKIPTEILQHYVYLCRVYVSSMTSFIENPVDDFDEDSAVVLSGMRSSVEDIKAYLVRVFDICIDNQGGLINEPDHTLQSGWLPAEESLLLLELEKHREEQRLNIRGSATEEQAAPVAPSYPDNREEYEALTNHKTAKDLRNQQTRDSGSFHNRPDDSDED